MSVRISLVIKFLNGISHLTKKLESDVFINGKLRNILDTKFVSVNL